MASEAFSGSSGPEISFTKYWIALVPSEQLRTVLTPDFLSYNGVLPRHWSPRTPVFLGQEFTEIVFDNGFSLQVSEDRVELAVALDGGNWAEVGTCNYAVLRLLEVLPGLNLKDFSVGIEGYSFIPDGCPGIKNIGTSLDGQLPVVSHQSEFFFSDWDVSFYAREVTRGESDYINCLDFRLLNSCSADSVPETRFLNVLGETLEDWEELSERFVQLATGFYSRHIEAG